MVAGLALVVAPVAFLFRDPVEGLVSYRGDGGIAAAVSGYYASLWGGDDLASWSGDDLPLLVLTRICERAVSYLSAHPGLAVNYRDMPDAVPASILPHFAIPAGGAAREAMRAVSRMDAKVDGVAFTQDSDEKQHLAGEELRARAHAQLGAAYRALETLAARGSR